jgi:hypothetical protein
MANVHAHPERIPQGGRVRLTLSRSVPHGADPGAEQDAPVEWSVDGVGRLHTRGPTDPTQAHWDVPEDQQPAAYTVRGAFLDTVEGRPVRDEGTAVVVVTARPFGARDSIQVHLGRADTEPTDDQALWTVIRRSTDRISFNAYARWIDGMLCAGDDASVVPWPRRGPGPRALPFPGVDGYRLLKVATEVFLLANCGVHISSRDLGRLFTDLDLEQERERYASQEAGGEAFRRAIETRWRRYISAGPDPGPGGDPTTDPALLPYLGVIRLKLGEQSIDVTEGFGRQCYGILRDKLTFPFLLELIWSYWHEEGMLVQSIDAVARRFQNVHAHGAHDPLAHMEIDPLRAINPLLWGYIQDEQHRLTALRRAYEYDHHYGVTALASGMPALRPADSRPRFLEAFHTLLGLASAFYKDDDDTTVIADGFPVLNALKDVHLLLTEGQHNQYGDLPWTARQEMLMQQWLLARPEMREFLPGRTMVAYPEPWMERVDTMKRLQGWSPDTVIHFRDLGRFGEQILLAVRFGEWTDVHNRNQAANWARYWRTEIQGYLHSYRAVTGVDLSVERTADARVEATPPALLLHRRLLDRSDRRGQGTGLPGTPSVSRAPFPARRRAERQLPPRAGAPQYPGLRRPAAGPAQLPPGDPRGGG